MSVTESRPARDEPSTAHGSALRWITLFDPRRAVFSDQIRFAGGSSPALTPLWPEAEDPTPPVAYDREVIAASIAALMRALPARHDGRAELAHLQATVAALDPEDPIGAPVLDNIHRDLVDWFATHHDDLRRQLVGGGPGEPARDASGPRGRRVPALRQFFDESAQLAAHHALALAGDAAVRDLDHALGLGGFADPLDEDDLRARLAARRADLPVIGNLRTAQTLADLVALDDHDQLDVLNIDAREREGLASFVSFQCGDRDHLVAVVNAHAHLDAAGDDWLAVELSRRPDGSIDIVYLDARDADVDHGALFAMLRAVFAALPLDRPVARS